MKALSIRQPWAWAIVHGGKDVENRGWRTHYRGPFLIHAAGRMTRVEYQDGFDVIRKVFEVEHKFTAIPPMISMKTGGIIGMAELVDCVSRSESLWFAGGYGFVLRNARPLPFTPCRGSLGFFEVPGFADQELL